MSQPLVKVENLTIEYNSDGTAFKAVDDDAVAVVVGAVVFDDAVFF